jgi:hypothetical protein
MRQRIKDAWLILWNTKPYGIVIYDEDEDSIGVTISGQHTREERDEMGDFLKMRNF